MPIAAAVSLLPANPAVTAIPARPARPYSATALAAAEPPPAVTLPVPAAHAFQRSTPLLLAPVLALQARIAVLLPPPRLPLLPHLRRPRPARLFAIPLGGTHRTKILQTTVSYRQPKIPAEFSCIGRAVIFPGRFTAAVSFKTNAPSARAAMFVSGRTAKSLNTILMEVLFMPKTRIIFLSEQIKTATLTVLVRDLIVLGNM